MTWNMERKRCVTFGLLLASVVSGYVLTLTNVVQCQNHGNSSLEIGLDPGNVTTLSRWKRRVQPQNGFFFPIAMYTVRHHRPANSRGRTVRPESWEYRGQYFYGYRPRPRSSRRRAARLLAAGLPLLLAPLLSIIFSFPVVVPVTQMTTYGGAAHQPLAPLVGRKRRSAHHQDKEDRLKELRVVSDYLHQVDYDEKQQSRVMVNYLQCNGLLGTDDHCLERLSCEFGDPANENAPEIERTVTSILLGHLLNNEFLPRPFKKRLKTAAQHGRNNSGQCNKFFCHYVDNNWDYASMYPPSATGDSDQQLHNLPTPQHMHHSSEIQLQNIPLKSPMSAEHT